VEKDNAQVHYFGCCCRLASDCSFRGECRLLDSRLLRTGLCSDVRLHCLRAGLWLTLALRPTPARALATIASCGIYHESLSRVHYSNGSIERSCHPCRRYTTSKECKCYGDDPSTELWFAAARCTATGLSCPCGGRTVAKLRSAHFQAVLQIDSIAPYSVSPESATNVQVSDQRVAGGNLHVLLAAPVIREHYSRVPGFDP
jgi:hypothetical protein